jgi:hypothetical protein
MISSCVVGDTVCLMLIPYQLQCNGSTCSAPGPGRRLDHQSNKECRHRRCCISATIVYLLYMQAGRHGITI